MVGQRYKEAVVHGRPGRREARRETICIYMYTGDVLSR